MKRTTTIPSGKVNARRRTFVKLAAVSGGAIVVTGVCAKEFYSVAELPPRTASPSETGYHLTPHIQSYYDKARF